MKIILDFYLNNRKVDAWLIDTKELKGKPPVIRIDFTTGTTIKKGP